MNTRLGTSLLCLILVASCAREKPAHLENLNLGIAATFPGQPRLHRYNESTPFGEMEWFSTTYEPSGRLDQGFFIDVGNLPPGDTGGSTPQEVLTTMRRFLRQRIGAIEATDLPAGQGPGFRYHTWIPGGEYIEGIVVVRRGRIHRAQATVSRPENPDLKAFLDSFQVLP